MKIKLSDVEKISATPPANGEVLTWNSTLGIYEPKAIPTPAAPTVLGNPVYTVALAPTPVGKLGGQIYVTNPSVGQPRPYWSDNTNWRDATGSLLA